MISLDFGTEKTTWTEIAIQNLTQNSIHLFFQNIGIAKPSNSNLIYTSIQDCEGST